MPKLFAGLLCSSGGKRRVHAVRRWHVPARVGHVLLPQLYRWLLVSKQGRNTAAMPGGESSLALRERLLRLPPLHLDVFT